ncbi:MAG: FtsX-like permease family protein [Chloroflexota bacterium]|nr:FtsX-like permease family protein [Chloroflexota bacterium]
MDDIFGISMNAIMLTLLSLLGFCILSVVWVAFRRPVIFKLGVRNIPRRRAQSGVVVLGLMLSTLIFAAALGTGDTIDHSVTGDVYDNLGAIDELVVSSRDSVANVDLISEGAFPYSDFEMLATALGDDSQVDALMPMLDARASVVNQTRQLAEPGIVLSGIDPGYLAAFGGLTATDGVPVDLGALGSDDVVVSAGLATDLDAAVGDQLVIFYNNTPTNWTVAAIAEDSYLSGTRRGDASGLETGGLAVTLAGLQDVTGQPGLISAIAISNTGDARGGVARTDAVAASISETVPGKDLGIDPVKQDQVERAEQVSTRFTGIFLVLGLFSIAAGVLLIVLIFTMLAAERRSEMGMERAIGTHQRQLLQQFVSEGSGYAILAGLIGSALGVAAAFGIAEGMKLVFGDYVPIEAKVTLRSLIVAYCAGVVITFVTVVVSSWKISRISIVAAVRDIPDVPVHHRSWKALVWGTLLILAGGFLTLQGLSGDTALPFMSGMSLVPFGIALVLGYLGVPGRPLYTVICVALLVFWLLPADAFSTIFGEFDGGIAMFFVAGIVLVAAVTLLIVNNLNLLLNELGRLGGLFRSTLPAMRTAIAYPSAAKGRTGMTIAMFSLIVFSLVMMATMSTNYAAGVSGDEANAGWHVRADSVSAEPIGDFIGTLNENGVDISDFKAVGVVHSPTSSVAEMRLSGNDDPAWTTYPVFGMETSFLDGSTLRFRQRAVGYDTDEAILEALRTQPNVAIVDVFAVPQDGDLGGDDAVFSLSHLSVDDTTFEPVVVDMLDPASGASHPVTVIGVLDESISSLYGLFASQSTIDSIYHTTATTSWFVSLTDPDGAAGVARDIEAATLRYGVSGHSIQDELAAAQAEENGFLYIIEGFMGLGLLVGIAAVGVIAFRSVVERRQQIGVMRALGFQRRMVTLSFLVETLFVVGVGGLAGTVLGVLLARNLLTGEDGGVSDSVFLIPWTILLVIGVLTNVAALLMTWIPAIQAGRIAPAEALRYE